MSKDVILAIDQGTTGTTALLVDSGLNILASKNIEFRQIYPRPGWVEHSLDDIWESTLGAIRAVLKNSGCDPKNIKAIGITNQRETVCFWDKKTGKPLHHAIVWQDRRTADFCKELTENKHEPKVQKNTGLLLDPYFSGTKVHWALKNVDAVQSAVKSENCAFGTIDSYLIHKLTNRESHTTEPSNASRTLLYNIEKLDWDEEMLDLLEVPKSILPKVLDSTDLFGKTSGLEILPDGIPIHGVLGDQQAALLGQACTKPGMAKCTYGTGSFILLNTGDEVKYSKHRLLTTIAWRMNGKISYALEGGAFTAGASVQWFRDGLGLIEKSSDIEPLAASVESSDGVVFVPAFVGIGAPHWMADARASFFGITRGTTKAHMARAILEGVAFMNTDILKAMESDLGRKMQSLNVDGGAARNNLLMQFQSDILERKLVRPKVIETTSFGAVFAAGLGVGLWQDFNELEKVWSSEKEFNPSIEADERQSLLQRWSAAIAALKNYP